MSSLGDAKSIIVPIDCDSASNITTNQVDIDDFAKKRLNHVRMRILYGGIKGIAETYKNYCIHEMNQILHVNLNRCNVVRS